MTSPPDAAEPIQAYYKLSFPNFEYYLQTLSVTIGRRPQPARPSSPEPTKPETTVVDDVFGGPSGIKREDADALLRLAEAAQANLELQKPVEVAQNQNEDAIPIEIDPPPPPPASPHPSTSSAKRSHHSTSSAFPHIDVDLGPLKSVSRLHARIDYDDTIDKFVLYVNGRNGAWVDGQWVGCGGRVALGARTKVQIGSRTFYFVLPPPVPTSGLTPETTPEADADQSSADDPILPLSPQRQSFRRSTSNSPSPPNKRRRLNSPSSKSPILSSRILHSAHPKAGPSSSRSKASSSSTQSSKTVRRDQAETDSESETYQLVSIGDLGQDDLDELQAMDAGGADTSGDERQTKGSRAKAAGKADKDRRGKNGKSSKGVKGRATKTSKLPHDPDPNDDPQAVIISSGSGGHNLPIRPLPAKVAREILKATLPPPDPNEPKQPKKYMTQRLLAKAALMQVPRPPPDQMPPKPPFTYAVLCYRAIKELGGKASLSEIVTWIRETHEWYRWNDECGWESSVRHNLSSNPGFVKSRRDAEVERIVVTTGQQKKVKGFFWSIDPKAEESFAEKEREIVEAGSRAKAQQRPKPGQPGKDEGPSGIVAGKGVGPSLPPSANPAMPVPMMAPRGVPGQPVPPQPAPGMQAPPVPHIMPPPMMVPPAPSQAPPYVVPGPAAPPPAAPPHLSPPVPTPTPPAVPPPASPAFPQALPDVCLSITVGPPPPGAHIEASTSPYIDGPPITLHNGALFLNPTIFSGLSQSQLEDLQKLKAQQALEILMGYTKDYVKQQIVKKGKAKAKAKPAKGSTPSDTSGTPGPKDGAPNTQPSTAQPTPAQALASAIDSASILALANLASASATPTPPVPTMTPTPAPTLASTMQPRPGMPQPYAFYPSPYSNGWSYPAVPPPPPHFSPPPAASFPPKA